ncbi:MAG: 4-hydroxy-tetrahydrodipicolinate reductase [Acidimicrobiaceae bacterium]|nr:4-hydroxy-tetrahydrodipicolinate reductase [Acidimicrobiaceae bacterium]MXW62439.1 4-hydroxy-tetrahydrodipicolinate reductase [Acidimicrobiaceae bacterium]MXW77377.1 4-hydroxy-tetrahydrodipicolinate reductase [Acidimicrobiaceae bacterium]MYC41425.1 4-hydroxy-tetrahydrodipicolinate reductase [Acidimicrobiaceae bacterium]MYD06458.1 4-hydroxy-tetrahydrodipicolinate reductase [Acidimicrobiaceae bacterium]
MTRVGVVGAEGRMGQEVCRAVKDDPALELVAAIDIITRPTNPPNDLLEVLLERQCEVVVDFTVASAARETLRFLAANGIHAVVGTTGFSDEDLAQFADVFTESNCLIAPNFAIGAVLMMRFAELAAPHFSTAEVIEYHHDAKIDAPSGTAIHTADRIASASAEWGDDPTEHEVLTGARGGQGPGGVRVHSVRMTGVVANQEVLMGTTGQTLSIRHDTIDRTSFMPGVLLGCKRIAEFEGLTLGLDAFLDL